MLVSLKRSTRHSRFYSGQVTSTRSDPNFTLCLIQASLIYGGIVLYVVLFHSLGMSCLILAFQSSLKYCESNDKGTLTKRIFSLDTSIRRNCVKDMD